MGEELLKKRWCEVFLLSLSQCSDRFNLRTVLRAMLQHLRACLLLGQLSQDRFDQVKGQIDALICFMVRCRRFNVKDVEYAYLKLIAFSAPGNFINNLTRKTGNHLAICNWLFKGVLMMGLLIL